MQLDTIQKLTKDLRQAGGTLGRDEARFLVDAYYMLQEDRKRTFNQERSLDKQNEPHELITWLANQSQLLEKQILSSLDVYSANIPEGQWARRQIGIGPVIAAGLNAHIDLEKTTTTTRLWRYAGQDPTSKWEKGQKRPWNASLKVLCWKIGESFVKTCNHEQSFYGPIYIKRKELEIERNEAGMFAEQAKAILETKRIGKETEAYKAYSVGKLPPAHIHSRAKRYAVKMFLSHYLEMAQRLNGLPVTTPYILSVGGHSDYIPPPA